MHGRTERTANDLPSLCNREAAYRLNERERGVGREKRGYNSQVKPQLH